jgi:tetratricopeptide (TPR) repeat protein
VTSYFDLLYELNVARFPIFWEGIESGQFLMDRFIPHYLVFQILPPNVTVSSHDLDILNIKEIENRIGRDAEAEKVYGNHLFNYGVYYQWRNDIPAAERHYRDSLKLYPHDTRALNNLGAILAQTGREQEAFEKFSEAFRIDPNDPTSNHNVGQALMDRGKIKEATLYFRRAIAYGQPAFEDCLNLGVCYASSGKNELAAKFLKKALDLQPDSPEALSSLGVVYLRLKETESAKKLLESVVELEPDNAENWYNLSCLQALEGDLSSSSASLEKALTLDHNKTCKMASKDHLLAPLLNSLLKNN